jgi:hypothetical protein
MQQQTNNDHHTNEPTLIDVATKPTPMFKKNCNNH